jgi:hypothetical protein
MSKHSKQTQKKDMPGHCPNCGSTNLDYECSDGDCGIREYPFVCANCGTHAKEIFREVFLKMEIT